MTYLGHVGYYITMNCMICMSHLVLLEQRNVGSQMGWDYIWDSVTTNA